MKKKLLILLMGLSMVFAQLLVAPMAIAEGGNAGGNSGGDSGNNSGGTGFGNATCPETHFMGLRAWYDGELLNKVVCGGEQPANEGEIRQLVWMIVLNIATMVLQIAGYVCVGRGPSGCADSGVSRINGGDEGLRLAFNQRELGYVERNGLDRDGNRNGTCRFLAISLGSNGCTAIAGGRDLAFGVDRRNV